MRSNRDKFDSSQVEINLIQETEFDLNWQWNFHNNETTQLSFGNNFGSEFSSLERER